MKISLWIPAVVLYIVRVASCKSVQVGTVLFTTTDLVKKCWTESDKSLLKARLIMQDVLPDPDCIDFSNPEAIAILLDYFHTCYQIISVSTYGKLQNLMFLALSDAFGGYLRSYVLPFTKRAYYAGQVKYLEAKKLYQLYDDIRVFLKSNGVGWAEPQKLCSRCFHVRPLVITGGALEACKELYLIERPGKLHCINPNNRGCCPIAEPSKGSNNGRSLESQVKSKHRKSKCRTRGKRLVDVNGHLRFSNFINSSSHGGKFLKKLTKKRTREQLEGMREGRQCDCSVKNEEQGSNEMKRVVVPLPILDDCESPHTIAVPFLKRPLRNLKTACSAFVLEYYYVAVVKCFIAKGNSRSDIKNFNGQFYSWLTAEVVPHLCEEQWYPGFGGVLRVLQTIKKFGFDTTSSDPVMHDIAFLFKEGMEFSSDDNGKCDHNGKGKDVRDVTVTEEDFGCPNPERHTLIAIIIVSMIWLFIFCAFAFYCQATRGRKLLYEGRPSGSGNSQECGRDSGSQDNNINLQFLVRFFKRQTEPWEKQKEKQNDSGDFSLNLGKFGPKPSVQQQGHPPRKRKHCFSLPKDKFYRGADDRDCFAYFSSLMSSVLPSEPYLTSFDERSGGDHKFHSGEGDQVHMLWKKPTDLFNNSVPSQDGRGMRTVKRRYGTAVSGTGSEDAPGRTSTNSCSACLEGETKGYTTEKLTSTCNCSGGCPFANTTTTTTTSSTQLEGKLSSATMEFFEEVISKHKAKKRATQDSTAESESECSTSSETDY